MYTQKTHTPEAAVLSTVVSTALMDEQVRSGESLLMWVGLTKTDKMSDNTTLQ